MQVAVLVQERKNCIEVLTACMSFIKRWICQHLPQGSMHFPFKDKNSKHAMGEDRAGEFP